MKLSKLICTLILINALVASIYSQSLSEKETFHEQFIGTWVGEGKSDDKNVRDKMSFEWAFGKRFLKFKYQALLGDNYKGEGYIWFNKKEKCFEYYEFNNGRWAVRKGIVKITGNKLVISEKRKDVEIEIVFEFIKPNEIKMTESYVRENRKETFVNIKFRKQEVPKR